LLARTVPLRDGAIDIGGQVLFIRSMSERRDTAVQLVAFAAFLAAMIVIVLGSLTFIATQCTQGTPFLPVVFPCFP
jgi:hypothetical protein